MSTNSLNKFKGYIAKFIYLAIIATISILFLVYGDSFINLWVDHPFIILSSILIGAVYIHIQAFNFLKLLGHIDSFDYFMVVKVWSLTGLANYLGPFQPGLIIRFGFFKSHNISLTKTAKTTVRQIQLNFLAGFILVSISLILGFESLSVKYFGLCLLIFIIIMPLLLNLIRYIFINVLRNIKLKAFYHQWLKEYLTFPSFNNFYLFFIQHSIMALLVYIVYTSFINDFSIFEAYLTGILTTLSALVSIAPNNLGIQELIFGQLSVLKGTSTAQAIGISLIFRIAQIGGCLVSFLFSNLAIYFRTNLGVTK